MTETIVRHCAPTLAGIKTGSMVNCALHEAEHWVECMKPALTACDMQLVVLRRCSHHALLYVYRPSKLMVDLRDERARDILEPLGYDITQVHRCVEHLQQRFSEGHGFPHEVGLFLGYPPEDVLGFVANGGKDYKCCGNWKVYGDEMCARRMFAGFRACTHNLMKRYQCGVSFEQLIVPDG